MGYRQTSTARSGVTIIALLILIFYAIRTWSYYQEGPLGTFCPLILTTSISGLVLFLSWGGKLMRSSGFD